MMKKLVLKILELKKNKKTIGMVHGVFDVVHVGHMNYFQNAKKKCDFLIASVTSDKFVNKGIGRPVFNIKDRIKFLQSVKYIDEVVVSDNPTAVTNIKKIKPDFYIKGKDYSLINVSEDKNLTKELRAIKSVKGSYLTTASDLFSSSKIIKEKFSSIDRESIEFISTLDSKVILSKLATALIPNKEKKILIYGEPIIDEYINVEVQGKSQKNNILTSNFLDKSSFGGGVILVSNFLSEFFFNVSLILVDNQYNKKKYNKFLNKKITKLSAASKKIKIITKTRFADNYSGTKLFQLNTNHEKSMSKNDENKIIKLIKISSKKYSDFIIFDYGHGYFTKKIIATLEQNVKNLMINCQSNSSNYGFNLISKYKKSKVICMDESEFRLSVNDKISTVKYLLLKNKNFIKKYKTFIVTLGSNGSYAYEKNKLFFIPTIFKNKSDTTGCGDIFFSTYCFFDTFQKFTIKEKVFLSHVAAGIHANTPGNKNIINKKIFLNTVKSLLK